MWCTDIEACWSEDLEGIKAAPRPNAKAPPPLAGAAGAAIGLHFNRSNQICSNSAIIALGKWKWYMDVCQSPGSSRLKPIQERWIEIRSSASPYRLQPLELAWIFLATWLQFSWSTKSQWNGQSKPLKSSFFLLVVRYLAAAVFIKNSFSLGVNTWAW